ncbi:MAG: amidohydrolase family protein [Acidobacteria bacterium]|nr:amidohydrolase family protein [Acidobacteriota bacterium]
MIDVHVHSTNTSPQDALARMKSLNIRFLVVSSLAGDLPSWAAALNSTQFLPALVLPCAAGRAPITGRPCFDSPIEFPDVTWLTGEVKAGRIKVLGEVQPQYLGLSPGDPRMEPYWQLAAELDIPVGIHMGAGPPGIAYDSSPIPVKSPLFRMTMSDPLLLEDVLLRHQRLRVFVMHAGWPQLERMIALLYAHPNVYVDVAALQTPALVPRSAYYRHLRGLVEAGFGKRIMFGSDFPNQAAAGIDAIIAADFLSQEQKSDILCNNAARFLRLDPSVCAQ